MAVCVTTAVLDGVQLMQGSRVIYKKMYINTFIPNPNFSYSECAAVALATQHTKCIRRFLLSSVAYLSVPYFSTLSQKRHDFRKKVGRFHPFYRPRKALRESSGIAVLCF
jgi:hypothetical protein